MTVLSLRRSGIDKRKKTLERDREESIELCRQVYIQLTQRVYLMTHREEEEEDERNRLPCGEDKEGR